VEKMETDDKPAAEKSGPDQQRQIKEEGDAPSTKMEVDKVKREKKCEELERPPSKKQKPEKREEWVTKTPSQPPKATTESPKALPQPSTAPKEPTKAKSQPTTSTTSHAPNATSQPQKAPAQQPPKSSEPALAGMSKTAPPKMGKIELLPIQKTGTEVIDIDDSDDENENAIMDAPKEQDKKSSEPALAGPSKDAPPKKGTIQLFPIRETELVDIDDSDDENDNAMDTPKEEVELEEEEDNEGNFNDNNLMEDASAGEDSDDGDFGFGEDIFEEEHKKPTGKRWSPEWDQLDDDYY